MEYRGLEYSVVRTIANGWRWTVKRDHNEKIGISYNREIAVVLAQRFIDDLIKLRSKGRAHMFGGVKQLGIRNSLMPGTWRQGKRVSRDVGHENREFGTVVEADGKIKVKWDSGRTSYYQRSVPANLKLELPQ